MPRAVKSIRAHGAAGEVHDDGAIRVVPESAGKAGMPLAARANAIFEIVEAP